MKTNQTADQAREAFLQKPVARLMLENAVPAVASMLFMALYQMADGILVGRRLGPDALASVNILYPVLAVIVGLAVMLGVGGNSRLANLLGRGEVGQARRVLGLICSLGLALGILGSLLVAVFFNPIIQILGSAGMGHLAGQYLGAMYPFYGPMILFFILDQALRNDNQAGLASAVMASMAVLNVLLNYIFLYLLDLGIAGAALATGIAQSLGALVFVLYFTRKTLLGLPGLSLAWPGGGFSALAAIAANGSSELFNSLALGVTTFLFNRIILVYAGELGVSAFALVQYLLQFGMTIIMGICNGAQPILSYNHGGGRADRVRLALAWLLGSSLLVGCLTLVILRWQGPLLASLFVGQHPQAIQLTREVMGFVSWSLLFVPVGIVGSAFFTALERVRESLLVAVARGFVLLLVGLALLPKILGEAGIWLTPVFAEGLTAAMALFLFARWLGWLPAFQSIAVKAAAK